MSDAVLEILERIRHLPNSERLELEELLEREAESEWQREAEAARRTAAHQAIDQSAIDRAVEKLRHGS